MPEFDSGTKLKIAALRVLRSEGVASNPYELVKVSWPAPDGAIYYATLPLGDLAVPPAVSPIQLRLIPDNWPGHFLPVAIDSSIGDEELELNLWDHDGVISDLIVEHGEGVQVELFYWFPPAAPETDPAEGLLLPVWHGHLRAEDEAEIDKIKVTAVQGFRSAEATLPNRAHYGHCSRVFGGLLDTQSQINEHGCPYNPHIGGGIGNNNPATGLPWTFCDRTSPASCTARGINPLRHMSHFGTRSMVINNQTQGPRLTSTSLSNATALKEPARVFMGTRRAYGMRVMEFRRDLNNNNPDHGWFNAYYEAGEGPVGSIYMARITVDGVTQNAVSMHYNWRLGTVEQTPLALSTHGYANTAYIHYNFGWVNPSNVDPNSCEASVMTTGLSDIRVYSDETTYGESTSSNRVWQIARMMCDKRWGFGYDYARLAMVDSWMPAASWAATNVRFTDAFGTNWDHTRAASHVELIERKVQQQIEDMCLGGRLSRPFLFNGKIHIEPLKALTTEELAAAPVFTDTGDTRNIIWEQERSTLKISRKSDLDLPNRIECTIDDATNDYLETPVSPIEDANAQLRAGRIVGDKSRKVNTKKYSLLGVVHEAQAMKLAWGILDLGPFDEGGLANNCRVTFKAWYLDSLDLHQAKVIKVASTRLTRYGFEYFRIVKMQREGNLHVKITAQAYNVEYMDAFETVFADIPVPPPSPVPDPHPLPDPSPCRLPLGSIRYEDGILRVPIDPC